MTPPKYPMDSGPERRLHGILTLLYCIIAAWWMAILYAFCGIICFVLIITIPLGKAAFRIAGYQLWPFGRSAVKSRTTGPSALILNIIWMLVFGWQLAIFHLLFGIILCVTIIGIDLGSANIKMIPIALFPLGVRIVRSYNAELPEMWGVATS